jgi:phosphatidate cytidylyltransferase
VNNFIQRTGTTVIGGAIFFGSYVLSPSLFFIIVLIGLVGAFLEWSFLARRSWHPALHLFPLLFLTLISYVFVTLDKGFFVALYPFYAAWIVDFAAYVGGSLIGRCAVVSSISPQKTLEGFTCGVLASVLLHRVLGLGVMQGVLVGLLAIGGDLFVSWCKRYAGLKDTGALLPGHGGLLDRGDSVLFVGFFALLKMLF